ncbi:alpha/beta hydrolase family protein [Tsukamurella soli]|uniref:Alpha/beta hydrolase n=1 Tax=Tsukamurella soli TaxID=644556 RepID=A0ABP8JS56_9ACTN
MGTLLRDDLFEAQLLRALGYAPYGGADVAECLSVARRISGTSLTSWHDEWSAQAARVLAGAEESASAGNVASARSAFFRASNYFRTAGLFAMGTPVDPRLIAAHTREVEAFRQGAALLAHPPTIVQVPYEGSSLPGYFFPAADDDEPRPTVILTNGYDGTAEELYFTNGAASLERGYNVLAFDGPGQGAMILDDGVPFRPDWENVITPVVDFLEQQVTVAPKRIALIGLSFGGYLAPRAATVEHRLAACISDCGPYDLFDATASRLPGFLAKQLPDGNPALLRLLDRLVKGVMGRPTAGWALRRNLMVHGLTDPMEFFRLAPQYTLKGIEDRIQCPTFVCSAENDDLSINAPKLHHALTCAKEYVQFAAADGAGEHCESGARTLFHRRAFDWLDHIVFPPTL